MRISGGLLEPKHGCRIEGQEVGDLVHFSRAYALALDAVKAVEDFLAALPDDRRSALQHLRELAQGTCPEAVEGFGYGMPGYKYRGRPLIYFSSFKKHMSLFAVGYAGINRHRAELADYEVRAGTIHFQAAKPLPDKLVKTMIKERMADIDTALDAAPRRRSNKP
jgi:uncharacterized protein YdhG (YjbR/CyaY superfamily)